MNNSPFEGQRESEMRQTIRRISTPIVAVLSAVLVIGALYAGSPSKGQKDIVDTAIAAGDFTTLVTALQAAGLVDALRSEGPFTVFAPTDEAFAKLPAGTIEALLADKEKLTAVLTYHVVEGKLMAADVVKRDKAKTLQGQKISIKAGSDVMVDDARVIMTDIQTSNGVIHVIDAVIVPRG